MKTLFIDIDGVILMHEESGAVKQWRKFNPPALCPGVLDFFDRVEKEGAFIVLTTSRKPATRPNLEFVLREYGIFWDMLVMGLPRGERILINDKKPGGLATARLFMPERNAGLEDYLC